jgi:diacylglycerol O-acyltransferase
VIRSVRSRTDGRGGEIADRLTALDASFLDVESPSAHMHVGWAAVLEPPERGAPSFEQLRDHIARRLQRAPRYRQRLATVPFGVASPEWVDDDRFDVAHHIKRSAATDLLELADVVMSTPLSRERPLWELWIADGLEDGRIGMVGKAHHCMVDGIAAVELGALLLDPTPDAAAPKPDRWSPEPPPGASRLLLSGALERLRQALDVAAFPARLASSPRRLARLAGRTERAGRALAHSLAPARPGGVLNEPLSPYRKLAAVARPFEDFRRVKRAFGVTVNDVVLAVATGAVSSYLDQHGDRCERLKAMVPVNVRGQGAEDELGNRISFMFLDLPCDEPDPERRLRELHTVTSERKAAGEPDGADAVLELASYAPSLVQRALTRIVSSPRTFNLVVSNIPGPTEALYLRGCPLREVYPVVPLADRHTLSIGFTTVGDGAFFGIYCDREALPDADRLAGCIDSSLDELLELASELRPAEAAAPAT